MKVYVVTAYRWGDHEKHSYVVGVYSSEKLASQAKDNEESYRGGKYECHIDRMTLDNVPKYDEEDLW